MSDGFDDPLAGVTPLGAAGENADAPPAVEAGPPPEASEELREALRQCARLPLNDYGNGQRFVVHFGADAMFVPRVGWFTWTGQRWKHDEDMLAIRRQAQRLSDLVQREIPHLELTETERRLMEAKAADLARRREIEAVPQSDRSAEQAAELGAIRKRLDAVAGVEKRLGERRNRHRSFANTTGNSTRIDNAAKEAGVHLAVSVDDLDAAPLDVNTESGVLRFSVEEMTDEGAGKVASVQLIPHDRGHRMTKMMPVAWDPSAPNPLFEAFLERIQPDREMREFLKRWFGVSMTGLTLQRMAFFHGSGANGKSVLVDLIARIMGDYAATARIESLTGTTRRGGGDATPDLVPLIGARMARTSEPDEGQRLQEGLIKEMTGGEPIMVRALHSDFVEVRPIFKLTMSGNHKPDIRGTDDGIWRRVLLVPFDVQIPENERDPLLGEKLWEERAGILAWMAEGLIDYLEGGLQPPSAVIEATKEYREESDPIGVFLTTCCVVTGDPADTIPSKELGDAFAYHLLERGMSPWKPATFARQISAKARGWRHPQTGKQFAKGKSSIIQYVGLRLTDAFRRRFDNAPRDHNGRPIGVASDSDRADNGEFI